MSQVYSDPSRASESWSLPDVETFYLGEGQTKLPSEDGGFWCTLPEGWYWWNCFPGCLPDGDPVGPFPSEAAAIADATTDPF